VSEKKNQLERIKMRNARQRKLIKESGW